MACTVNASHDGCGTQPRRTMPCVHLPQAVWLLKQPTTVSLALFVTLYAFSSLLIPLLHMSHSHSFPLLSRCVPCLCTQLQVCLGANCQEDRLHEVVRGRVVFNGPRGSIPARLCLHSAASCRTEAGNHQKDKDSVPADLQLAICQLCSAVGSTGHCARQHEQGSLHPAL